MTAGVWVRASPVAAGLAAARSRLPAGALELACHAAVPVAVDAGLLHLLRINFFLDPPTVLPYEAEAALLLSPLFREVGEDLYEIDPPLRDALLAALVAGFGPERPARVALLLEQYTDQHPAWHAQPELEHAQRLTALNLVDPARAADWLAANRTSAGGPALTREWFVAMTGRLRPRASLQDRLADALTAADAPSHELRRAAITELGELALLPGADLRAIALRLERVTRNDVAELRDLARDVLDSVIRLVPPPPPGRPVEEADDGYESVPFPDLYGIDPATFDPDRAWATPGNLTVVIGTDPDGRPVPLDLRDPGHGGMGPHTLIIGANGSGKSELLRSIVLGLAATNSPAELNVLIVDLYGGGTFAGLAPLPHLAGMATNLGLDPLLDDRLIEVLRGEVASRQQQATHRRPHLLIVVDDVGELLTVNPAITDTFVTIGQVGGPLGIHLLLAGHRLDEGRLGGLTPHLTARISLRVTASAESRAMLGNSHAAELPRSPGHGYLRTIVDNVPRRFRGTRVSGPFPPPPPSWDDVLDPFAGIDRATLLKVLTGRMAGHGGPVHQLWLPLPAQLALGDLPDEDAGGRVLLGQIDVPDLRLHRPFSVDLSGASGHMAVVGQPGSGRTTALQTVVTALARVREPRHVYCIGGELNTVAGLPYVGGVFHRHDGAAVDRLLAFLLRRPRDTAPTPLLLVDGWAQVAERHADLDRLVFDGRAVIVATDDHWGRFSAEHLATFGTFVELFLANPTASIFSAADAERLPRGTPGRGLVRDGLQLQVALPVRAVGGSHHAYVAELAAAWTGPPAPRVGADLRLRLGVYDDDGSDLVVDFARDPHLLLFDGSEMALTVLGAVAAWADGTVFDADAAAYVAELLKSRLPGPDVTPDQLRRRSWWSGPELWVVTSPDSPAALDVLIPFLPDARDLGFHLVLADNGTVGEPPAIVLRLHDLDTPTITVSGFSYVPDRRATFDRDGVSRPILLNDTYRS